MDKFILFTAFILILAYIGVAIWVICKRQTVGGSVGAAAGFLGGGLFIIPIAEAVATFICWAIVICIVLAVIGAVFGS